MGDHYENLRDNWTTVSGQINPNPPIGGNNYYCPETADSVHDYLNGGTITPVHPTNFVTYPIRNSILQGFQTVQLHQLLQTLRSRGHGHHVVVRAVRSQLEDQSLHHYFVVANVREEVYAFDAYGSRRRPEGESNIIAYLSDLGVPPGHIEQATQGYDVEVDDPLSGL